MWGLLIRIMAADQRVDRFGGSSTRVKAAGAVEDSYRAGISTEERTRALRVLQ